MLDRITTIPELVIAYKSGNLDPEDYFCLVRSLLYSSESFLDGPPPEALN